MRVLVLLAALWSQGMAGAQPPEVQRPRRLQFEWSAPAQCPSRAEVGARLSTRLPSVDAPLEAGAVPLEARAQVREERDGFVLQIEFESAEISSERLLRSNDCSLLADAAVLMIGVTLDPVGLAREQAAIASRIAPPASRPPSAPADTLASSGPSTPPDRAETPAGRAPPARPASGLSLVLPASAEPRSTQLRAGIRVFGSGGYGPTNTGYASVGGGIALLGPRWRVAADARWFPTRQVVLDTGAGGRFDAWLVGAAGCFVPQVRTLEIPVCLGLEAGQLRGRGVDTLPLVEEARVPHVALRLTPGLAWSPVERLALGFDLEFAVPVTRGSFTVDESEVQRVAAVGVRGLLSLEVRLP